MIGTVVDFSYKNSILHFVKVLIGYKLIILNCEEFPNNVEIGDQIEFLKGVSGYKIIKG